jgi:hypothetical protein
VGIIKVSDEKPNFMLDKFTLPTDKAIMKPKTKALSIGGNLREIAGIKLNMIKTRKALPAIIGSTTTALIMAIPYGISAPAIIP